jgi:hypothetical protein
MLFHCIDILLPASWFSSGNYGRDSAVTKAEMAFFRMESSQLILLQNPVMI